MSEPDGVFFWDEDDLVPATGEEMREGLRAAMAVAREEGWIPKQDPGCQCSTCRVFRAYVREG